MVEPTNQSRIADALLRLLNQKRFSEIGLDDIAREAGLSLGDIRADYDGKIDILRQFARSIDTQTLQGWTLDVSDETRRDRLFDAIMSRFDHLKPYRTALTNLARSARQDPALALCLNTIALDSARFLLAASGLGTGGLSGAARTQGLVLVMGDVFKVWSDDSDPDLARTMAALDRALERAQSWSHRAEKLKGAACGIAKRFERHRPRRSPPAASTVTVDEPTPA